MPRCVYSSSRRKGLTRIELVVLSSLLVLLTGLILPALVKANQGASEKQAEHSLKNMAVALHSIQDFYKKLPPAVGWFPGGPPGNWNATPANHGTIFYHLLPYLEGENIYKAATVSSWTSVGNLMNLYLSPSDPTVPKSGGHHHNRGAISYAANALVFSNDPMLQKAPYNAWGSMAQSWDQYSRTSIAQIVAADGASNTIAFGERFASCWVPIVNKEGKEVEYRKFERAWGESSQGFNHFAPVVSTYLLPQFGATQKNCEPSTYQGFGPDYIMVGLFDASVRKISSKISQKTWASAVFHLDGIPMGKDW